MKVKAASLGRWVCGRVHVKLFEHLYCKEKTQDAD